MVAQYVTNNSTNINLNYLNSIVEDSDPKTLIISYDLKLDNSVIPPLSAYSVSLNGTIIDTVESINIVDHSVKLILDEDVKPSDLITFSYTKPSSDNICIQCPVGNEAPSLSDVQVTNDVKNIITAIENNSKFADDINIYPNPAHDYLNIALSESAMIVSEIRIISSSGAIMSAKEIEPGRNLITFPLNISSGIYIVQLISGSTTVGSKKLVVQ